MVAVALAVALLSLSLSLSLSLAGSLSLSLSLSLAGSLSRSLLQSPCLGGHVDYTISQTLTVPWTALRRRPGQTRSKSCGAACHVSVRVTEVIEGCTTKAASSKKPSGCLRAAALPLSICVL
jgi:hypothetical protein